MDGGSSACHTSGTVVESAAALGLAVCGSRSREERPIDPGGGPNMAGEDRSSTSLANPAVQSCWLCGTRLPAREMVSDGGSACADLRWYCADTRRCTERWTSHWSPGAGAAHGRPERTADRLRGQRPRGQRLPWSGPHRSGAQRPAGPGRGRPPRPGPGHAPGPEGQAAGWLRGPGPLSFPQPPSPAGAASRQDGRARPGLSRQPGSSAGSADFLGGRPGVPAGQWRD